MQNKIATSLITHLESQNRRHSVQFLGLVEDSARNLGLDLRVSIIEWQPAVNLIGCKAKAKTLRDSFRNLRIGTSIFHKLESTGPGKANFFLSTARYFGRWTRFILNGELSLSRTKLRTRLLEQFLTEKHLFSYQNFLNSDAQALIVFEDDAKPTKSDSIERALAKCSLISEDSSPCYVDLSHYFSYSDLYFGAKNRLTEADGGYLSAAFFSNTTAAYIINRQFAKIILTSVQLKNSLRLVPIDWLLTHITQTEIEAQIKYEINEVELFQNDSLVSKNSSLGSQGKAADD